MRKQALFITILFFWLLSIHSDCKSQMNDRTAIKVSLHRLGLDNLESISVEKRAIIIAKVWDSMYTFKKAVIYEVLPISVWQNMFEQDYTFAIQQKNQALQLTLAFPLAAIYHTQSKFEKGLPVLQFLYAHKEILSREKYALTLVKLEEEYRESNQIVEALRIRNERVDNQFIHTYWELYMDCGLYKNAIADFKMFEPVPVTFNIQKFKYFSTLSNLYLFDEEADSAIKYAAIGLEELRKVPDNKLYDKTQSGVDTTHWHAVYIEYIAKALIIKEKFRDAMPLLEKSISMHKDGYNKVSSWIALSQCLIGTHQFQKTKSLIDSIHTYLNSITSKFRKLELIKLNVDYFKGMHQNDSAVFYLDSYIQCKDQILSGILKNQSSFELGKFEIEKRRNELLMTATHLKEVNELNKIQKIQIRIISILLFLLLIFIIILSINNNKRKNSLREIEDKNRLLHDKTVLIDAQNTHNKWLLKELHHRVKNNLQMINSLVNIQKRKINQKAVDDFADSIQSRIQPMAFIHEHLYAEGDSNEIDMQQYILKLIEHLRSGFDLDKMDIDIESDIDQIELPLEYALPIGLIINETVSNSFKYAFRETRKGILQISFKKKESTKTELTIEDNGIGFNITQIQSHSMGLKLIQIMCKQLKANYTCISDSGTKHTIVFSI